MKFHDLTRAVTLKEGGKKKVGIAQVNEITSLLLSEFKAHIKKHPFKGWFDILRLIKRAK